MKSRYILFAVLAILLGGAVFYFSQNKTEIVPQPSRLEDGGAEFEERKASFAIFTNGTFRIFTDSRYHNLSEDVHLTRETPNIITVTKKGVTWRDFFESLPMRVTNDCLTTGTGQLFCTNSEASLKFYLNGIRDDNVLDKEIMDKDKLLISYGDETEEEIEVQMQRIP